MQIGTIKEIWRYPVKSMFGERVSSAWMDVQGFADDRCWAVRDDISGEFVGGKKIPKLMLLKARYLEEPDGGFGPTAQSRVAIEFPDGRVVDSDDPYASAILSMFVGRRVTLCRRPEARNKQAYRLARPMSARETRYALGMKPDDPDPDFSSFSLTLLSTLSKYATPPGTLYDVYPLHFLTTAALETMRGHYPEGDFRAERYRPSFVIETSPNLNGIVENDWRGVNMRIGDAHIYCNHPTIRCSMPGAAQPGMDADPQIPLAVMKFADQHLGAYGTPRKPARIRVGDTVEILPKSTNRVYSWFDDVGRRGKSQVIKASNWLNGLQEDRVERKAVQAKTSLPSGFRPFTLVARQREAADVSSFWFADPQRRELPRFIPGQHIVLAIPRRDGDFLYRPYTLSGLEADGSRYRISVKREVSEVDGETLAAGGSGWLHDQLAIGDSVAIKDPGGQFADIPGDRSPLVLISAGIGITPFMAMLQGIAAENPQRPVTLLHGIRRLEDFAFAGELETLRANLPLLDIRVFVSQPGNAGLGAFMQAGRMQVSAQLNELNIARDAVYFVCGKPAFSKAIRDELCDTGVAAGQIRLESFGASEAVDHSDPSRYQIHYTQSQRRSEWDPQQQSLLAFTEAQGIAVKSGCRYGACEACEVGLLSGRVIYPPEVQPPAGKNRVLLCSARPQSDLEIEL